MNNGIFAKVIRDVSARGIANQVVNEGDYYDDKELLVCGKCKKHRQMFKKFEIGPESNRTYETLKVTCECDCERKIREQKELEKQQEAKKEYIRRLKGLSLMDEVFNDATFDNCIKTKYNERNFKMCKRYATSFDKMLKECQGLLLWGNVGTGKSYAAAAIANYLLEQKVPVIMTSFAKILRLIDTDRTEESNIIEKLNSAKLVIFDDLGVERGTDYALEKVYGVIDERYRHKLPMILTTNLTLEEMKTETDIRYARIYDRAFEKCYPIQFTGPSWRKVSAAKRYPEMEKFLEGSD